MGSSSLHIFLFSYTMVRIAALIAVAAAMAKNSNSVVHEAKKTLDKKVDRTAQQVGSAAHQQIQDLSGRVQGEIDHANKYYDDMQAQLTKLADESQGQAQSAAQDLQQLLTQLHRDVNSNLRQIDSEQKIVNKIEENTHDFFGQKVEELTQQAHQAQAGAKELVAQGVKFAKQFAFLDGIMKQNKVGEALDNKVDEAFKQLQASAAGYLGNVQGAEHLAAQHIADGIVELEKHAKNADGQATAGLTNAGKMAKDALAKIKAASEQVQQAANDAATEGAGKLAAIADETTTEGLKKATETAHDMSSQAEQMHQSMIMV